ncbi:MAG: hypothetical protein D6741_04825 [Planctomycetota bacterium]|nr:MAG: hypothetical protein D6741_04825 [Planctomycetota bacterium]
MVSLVGGWGVPTRSACIVATSQGRGKQTSGKQGKTRYAVSSTDSGRCKPTEVDRDVFRRRLPILHRDEQHRAERNSCQEAAEPTFFDSAPALA